jgi:hypothetical protein
MAIGDAVAQIMGTAETDRQPSSGVEEQIAAIVKNDATDDLSCFDGTTELRILASSARTDIQSSNASTFANMPYNTAIMITNSIYIRKVGTTDRISVHGVQTAT